MPECFASRTLLPLVLLLGLLLPGGAARGQNIIASVAPNENGSDNYVDIKNNTGGDLYFFTAPTPSTATMSRMDSSEITEYPWPSTGNFGPDPNEEYNRIYPGEFLRVYPNSLPTNTTIQVAFSYSPAGTLYDFNVLVQNGAQVTSLNITDPNPTTSATLHWEVTFDAPISGVTAANFSFANPDAITGVAITSVTPTTSQPASTWTVTASTGSGLGLLGVDWAGHQTESPAVPNSFVGEVYQFSIYPVLSLDLTNLVLDTGTTKTLTVAATIRGGAALNYQWYSGTSANPNAATPISGATSSSYTPPAEAGTGTWQYFCRVYTTTPDYTDSSTANLTVVLAPDIYLYPQSQVIATGGSVTLTVAALGTGVNYIWYQGNSGDTSDPVASGETLSVSNLTANVNLWVQAYNTGPAVANTPTVFVTVITALSSIPGKYAGPINTTYLPYIAVEATDSDHDLIPNLSITFSVPPNGPSGTFAGGVVTVTETTSSTGTAETPAFTGNGGAGIFNLTFNYGTLTNTLALTNYPVLATTNATFLTGAANHFQLLQSGLSSPNYIPKGALPPGLALSYGGLLSGTPPAGSAGSYPFALYITNSPGLQAAQNFTLTVISNNAVPAYPGFNTNGLAWTLAGDTINGGPSISGNVFIPTDGTAGESRSAWFEYPLYVGAFEASFTYQDVSVGGADGSAFVIQNAGGPTQPPAIAGGGLGYCGITNSVAVLLNLYSGANGGASGLMLGTNGIGAYDLAQNLSGRAYQSTAPVNLDGGDPINVQLIYIDQTLQVTLTDTVNSNQYQAAFPLNITAYTGTNTAWVGFTGSEGGVYSDQHISNFLYAPLPPLTPALAGGPLLSWPGSVAGFILQGKTNLTDPAWVTVSTNSNLATGTNQVSVAPGGSLRFYRLLRP